MRVGGGGEGKVEVESEVEGEGRHLAHGEVVEYGVLSERIYLDAEGSERVEGCPHFLKRGVSSKGCEQHLPRGEQV